MSQELVTNFINSTPPQARNLETLLEVSEALEANFLAEMLKHSGLNQTKGAFSGGPGEEAFASLLNQEFADALAKKGGIGLAETIFRSLTAHEQPDA